MAPRAENAGQNLPVLKEGSSRSRLKKKGASPEPLSKLRGGGEAQAKLGGISSFGSIPQRLIAALCSVASPRLLVRPPKPSQRTPLASSWRDGAPPPIAPDPLALMVK